MYNLDLANKMLIESTQDDVECVRNIISTNIEKDQNIQKRRHDANHVPAPKYKVGDLVKILRNNYGNDGKSTKLLSKFVGPFRISQALGNDRYQVTDIPGFPKRGKPYESVIAFDRVRPWINVKALEVHDSETSGSSYCSDKDE